MWVSKREYDEDGAKAIQRKTFWTFNIYVKTHNFSAWYARNLVINGQTNVKILQMSNAMFSFISWNPEQFI